MKLTKPILILILIISTWCSERESETFNYPNTKTEKIEDVFFGKNIADPYRWLEDSSNNDVTNWVNAQDELLRDVLHQLPGRDNLKNRIEELTRYDLFLSPQKVLNKYYYLTVPKGETKATIMQENDGEEPKVLFDPSIEFGDTMLQLQTTGGYPGYFISPDGKKMIYTIASAPSRWFSVKIRDLNTNNDYSEELKEFHLLSGNLSWDAKSEGFFYVKFSNKEANASDSPEDASVMYHKIGTSSIEDKVIFKTPDKGKWLYNLYPTEDDQYLVIEARDGSKIENRIIVKDLKFDKASKEILIGKKANYDFLGNIDKSLYLYTNLSAPNGKIVSFNLDTNEIHEIVPEKDISISAGSQVGGNAIGMFANRLLVTYTEHGKPLVKCFDKKGDFLYDTKLPIEGSIWGGFQGNNIDNIVFYRFLGFTNPSTIFKLDIESNETEVYKKSKIQFKDDDYITEQIFYQSKDGAEIPMYVTRKKDIKFNGNNPTIIYAYGAFNWISFLWYQPHLLAWLEMGGVYAQPSIRGGGEYGEDWHQAGVGRNRQNAVDDYIAASEWLIHKKFTSNELLVANGGSISSALAGNVLTQRPDLYGAVIIDRPALDMVRYDKFTTAGYWVDELGSPNDSLDFEILYKLSPYHQLDKNVTYPPVMVMVGDKDEVTPPLHSYKFLAAIQNTKAAKQNPMLLKMMWNTGHTFGSTPEQVVDSRTDEILFLIKVLPLKNQY